MANIPTLQNIIIEKCKKRLDELYDAAGKFTVHAQRKFTTEEKEEANLLQDLISEKDTLEVINLIESRIKNNAEFEKIRKNLAMKKKKIINDLKKEVQEKGIEALGKENLEIKLNEMRVTICEPMRYDLKGFGGPTIFSDLLNKKIESRATDTCVLKILQMPEVNRRRHWLKERLEREVSEGESKEDNEEPKLKKARHTGSNQAQKEALQKWKEDKKGGLLIYDTINVEYYPVRGLKMDARQQYDYNQQKIPIRSDDWDNIVNSVTGLKWDRHWIMTFIYPPQPPQLSQPPQLRFN